MARTVEQLDALLTKLITEVFPAFKQRIVVLEDEVKELKEKKASAPPAGKKKRRVTTYTDYLKVKALADAGKDIKYISESTEIPYSTVKGYLEWTPDKIAQKAKEEQVAAEKQAAAPPPPSENYTIVKPSAVKEEVIEGEILDEIDDLIGE